MGKDLNSRVAAREDVSSNGAAVATTEPPTLEKQIRQSVTEFEMAMPRGMEAAQLVRDALTALRRVPNLARCDKLSVLGSLMTCAQLGLRPNTPLGHAWVLPFWNRNAEWTDEQGKTRKGCYEAQLIIGYQGYRELVQRTGLVSTVIAHVVYKTDQFEVEYGLDERITHRPHLDGDRGAAVGYYAIIRYTSGGYTLAYMSLSEAIAHRDRYAMARKDGVILGPWRDNFNEMALKTAFLRAAKWAPKSAEMAYAVEADGRIRVNTTRELEAMAEGMRPGDEPERRPIASPREPNGDASGDPALAEQTSGTASPDLLDRINAWFRDRKIGSVDKLSYVSALAQRSDLVSVDGLTENEASVVSTLLDGFAATDDPLTALQEASAEWYERNNSKEADNGR